MSPYWAQLSANLRTLLRYRSAAIAGMLTQVFWAFLRLSIFSAFYASLGSSAVAPLEPRQLAAYVWLGQALFVLLPLKADGEVAQLVREGGIAYELTRPVDLYFFWLARSMALRLAPTALRFPFVIALGVLLPKPEWALAPPASWLALGASLLAVAIALVLVSALTTLLGVACLWTEGGNGVGQLFAIFAWVSSGMVLPLPFFPERVQRVLEWLPFAGVLDLPLRLYSGHLPVEAAGLLLGRSALWALGLIVIGRAALNGSLRRVVVQGG